MKQVEERYISLLTDFGFKRIFGTAMNKDLLICFLNSLFNGRQVVKDVSYLNPEHVGDVYIPTAKTSSMYIVRAKTARSSSLKCRMLIGRISRTAPFLLNLPYP